MNIKKTHMVKGPLADKLAEIDENVEECKHYVEKAGVEYRNVVRTITERYQEENKLIWEEVCDELDLDSNNLENLAIISAFVLDHGVGFIVEYENHKIDLSTVPMPVDPKKIN